MERAIRLIATFPAAGPRSPVVPTRDVRQRIVRGFPFVIVYRELDHELRIDAVAHTRRDPGYWAPRIE